MSESARNRRSVLIDAGNSFVKWALYQNGELFEHGQHRYRDDLPNLGLPEALSVLPANVDRVVAGSVASDKIVRVVTEAVQQQCHQAVCFEQVRSTFAGLTVAYQQPQSFGIDRWLALLGARTLDKSAFCVADCGTALTLDCVDERGKHIGGVIVPGYQLMTNSLLNETAKISLREETPPSSIFAANTGAAVSAGSTFALAAVLDRFVDEAKLLLSTTPLVVVTGGGRQRLINYAQHDVLEVPDLVLLGLAVVCDTHDG